mmetsp:Transcript_96836/g.174922  ORF Transcript_96836/g.174922 Transcript_96836/m.174922 type:complete len:84 (-) Transcript_96836:402-653(-)
MQAIFFKETSYQFVYKVGILQPLLHEPRKAMKKGRHIKRNLVCPRACTFEVQHPLRATTFLFQTAPKLRLGKRCLEGAPALPK